MKRSRTALIIFTALALHGSQMSAQGLSGAESKAFDRGDRESRALLATIACMDRLTVAVREKRVVSYEPWMTARQCVVINKHDVWVTIGGDTMLTRATRVKAYDLTTSAPYAARVNTASVLALARAERRVAFRVSMRFQAAKRPAAPLTFRIDRDSIAVWMVPRTLLSGDPWTLGGELGGVFSPDGREFVREVDRFDQYRTTTVADTGVVRIVSGQVRIPSISEFVLANQLHARDRSIVIEMPWGTSALARGTGSKWVWVVGRQ